MGRNNLSRIEIFEQEVLAASRLSYKVQLKLYDIFIPTLGIIIIVLNLMVLLSSSLILRKRGKPRSTYLFLGNIALADMLTGAMTIFGLYYPEKERSELVCCFQIGMIITATIASIYSIVLIAIDRYLYILYGLQYQRYVSSQRARLMTLCTWILGIVVGFLPAMGVRNPVDNGAFCWLIILEPTALILFTASVGITPLCVIVILYSIILRHALGKISEMKYCETAKHTMFSESKEVELRYFRGGVRNMSVKISNNAGVFYIGEETAIDDGSRPRKFKIFCCTRSNTLKISSVYSPSRWKAIKIVLLTTGCYFITWFPYFLACTLYAACDSRELPFYCDNLRLAIASPLAILGLTNSLFNPIIYAWWHNGFRESAKKIYTNVWKNHIKTKLMCAAGEHITSDPTKEHSTTPMISTTQSSRINLALVQ